MSNNNHKKINRRIDEVRDAILKGVHSRIDIIENVFAKRVMTLELKVNALGRRLETKGDLKQSPIKYWAEIKQSKKMAADMLNNAFEEPAKKEVAISCVNKDCPWCKPGYKRNCSLRESDYMVKSCDWFKENLEVAIKADEQARHDLLEHEIAVYIETLDLVCMYIDENLKVAAPALIQECLAKARGIVRRKRGEGAI